MRVKGQDTKLDMKKTGFFFSCQKSLGLPTNMESCMYERLEGWLFDGWFVVCRKDCC